MWNRTFASQIPEIQSKLREDQQRLAAQLAQTELVTSQRLEQQFKADLEKQKKAAEKKATAEAELRIKKLADERDQTAKKLKESQEREATIRKQAQEELEKEKLAAAKKATHEAEGQIKKALIERDQLTKKLKDAEVREALIRKQTQEETEKRIQKELAEQRQALEKDKESSLTKQQAAAARDREGLIKKVQRLESQLKRKTANELGDGAEIDLFDALKESFTGDNIYRIPKGKAGADIIHEVLYKGEPCGRIIIDSKNRQSWHYDFVGKLRQDQVESGAEHAILATTVFPAGKKEICNESGVIVVSPVHVVHCATSASGDGRDARKGPRHEGARQ